MPTTRIASVFSNLSSITLLLALAAPAAVLAEFECTQELMAGTWVSHADLWIMERAAADAFPPPGPFSSTGIFVNDAQGRAVVAHQTNSTSMRVTRPDSVLTFDTKTTINPDCTGKITQSLRQDLPPSHPFISRFGYKPGQVVFELDMVCSNGQRECQATFTEPAAVLIGVVKSALIDPAAATGADLSRELTSIKANIAALSRRLGIVPQ